MGKSLQLNFKYVKPSLLKGPFRYSNNNNIMKKSASDEDVPDLASSSCASEQESKKPMNPSVTQEESLAHTTEQHQHQHQQDAIDGIPCIQEELSSHNNNNNNNSSDLLSAVLKHQQDDDCVIAADCEQRLVVRNCIPSNIVLLPDYDYSQQKQQQQDEGSESSCSVSTSSLERRLENAEALIHSYRDTIRSNEHLIDSLHHTLSKTREEAINVMSSHKDLEEAVQCLLEEREEADMMITEPKIFLKMAMATSLMLYFFGLTTEYPLIATVMVFLMEGFL